MLQLRFGRLNNGRTMVRVFSGFLFLCFFSSALAGEVFVGSATQLKHFEVDQSDCPENSICHMHGWFTYQFIGESLETGEYVDVVVGGIGHTWYRTDVPWLVTLSLTVDEERYTFLEADYLIDKFDFFDSFICTKNESISELTDPDMAPDENGNPCFSMNIILDAIPK